MAQWHGPIIILSALIVLLNFQFFILSGFGILLNRYFWKISANYPAIKFLGLHLTGASHILREM